MRRWVFFTAGLISAAFLAMPLSAVVLASSTFNTNNEGWASFSFAIDASGYPNLAASFGGASAVNYNASGGNPGGYISKQDPDGGWQYFTAGPAFLGNQGAAFGGSISFDMIRADQSTLTLDSPQGPLVAITDGTTILVYAATFSPPVTAGWTHYVIPFPTNAANWRLNNPLGPAATPSQLSAVLSALSGLYIFSDWYKGADAYGLDNVVLSTTATPPNGLSLNRTTLNFGSTPNKSTITSGQQVNVTVPAGVSWSAASNQSYVSVAPMSGVGSGSFTVSVVAASLPSSGTSTATVTVAAPGTTNSPQTVAVSIAYSSTNVPFGSFDTPLNNAGNLAGAIPVTGWSLDNIEVAKVQVWREPVGSEPAGTLVYIGDATLVTDARPDVQAVYPNTPYNYRAGWGYMLLTNFLPGSNGTFKLHAISVNTVGAMFDLGTHTISVNNAAASKPFGTLDTPAQGGTANGNQYMNFGWALTQNPNVIPFDGHTITVQVDGQNLGNPAYNNYRADIATLFPGLMNSQGAVGVFILDTTKLLNGVHTIDWIVFDNVNHGDGIGSRYFTIFNSGSSTAPESSDEPVREVSSVQLRRGYDVDSPAETLTAGKSGWLEVEVEEVSRLELELGAVSGHSIANDNEGGLPIGSSMKDGTFYWQLGPGFLGKYELIFDRPDGSQVYVRVTVRPKTGRVRAAQ